jgi:unsaturated chondroitin disaccharide hydrolase
MKVNTTITPSQLVRKIERLWELSAGKILSIEHDCDPAKGSPVFTVEGRYTTRGWTEWTQGFQFGSAILQFDATGDSEFLDIGRSRTLAAMAPHVGHFGVHDHGFNNVSTYGNLLRLMGEGRIADDPWERCYYELALKLSGAIQARRWTKTRGGGGFIYSFNGPHSLFVDTIRSLRALAVAHKLGHAIWEENDRKVSLLDRLHAHATATAKHSVYYGEGRDLYDICGRVAHESIFNTNDGTYRCPNSQQGYSPFSTWTRGLAWAMCGFAEQLEFLAEMPCQDPADRGPTELYLKAARATCDFYIEHATAADGIPYWDTGAPNLHRLGDWQGRPADPFNAHEPVDSSAAAIAAQGLLRLGHYLKHDGRHGTVGAAVALPQPHGDGSTTATPTSEQEGRHYWQAGLTVLDTLLDEPYLSTDTNHQGLILHSIYHRPNGWDHVPHGRKVPCGESSMWGDYHAREAALYVERVANHEPALTFWGKFA